MVKQERIEILSKSPYVGEGPVIYWMNRDCRIHDNWAYLYAREIAHEAKRPLIVVYNLAPGFLQGGRRQHVFKVHGLEEVAEECAHVGTPFFLVGEHDISATLKKYNPHSLVTDFSPLRIQRAWVDKVVAGARCSVYEVDAHNIVPCRIASQKAEFAARTFRPKVHRLIAEYLEPFPRLTKHAYAYEGTVPTINWGDVLNLPGINQDVTPVDWIVPGYEAGMKTLKRFVEHRLEQYGEARNNPNTTGQSGLSPYLHYGQIAPARVVLSALGNVENPGEVAATVMHPLRNGSGEQGSSLASFLEELIVRRELSDNFCFYTPGYDSVSAFPEWSQKTLAAHREDERPYLYTRRQFEEALTHDDLWNAAQRELIRTGKMHGYMRMYWGKKILEWTKSPEEAMSIAIYLNDTYELDGRDPNGYAGIAWSIGGMHDRLWFTRPIFGTVRYMARSGCEKKFDVTAYIKRFS